ncbi:hypothetical protein GCM10028808_69290 [Spirosoma migulaei]
MGYVHMLSIKRRAGFVKYKPGRKVQIYVGLRLIDAGISILRTQVRDKLFDTEMWKNGKWQSLGRIS